jgi:uncharacterized membrane protein
MRTSHGFARLVGFSDGVVAIAITLLILPLVDAASNYHGDVGGFVTDHVFQVLIFLLSFAVIGNFWYVHHQMYERVTSYSGGLIWANLLWLLSIVFLPFPTELLASSGRADRAVYALYVGTMVVTTAAGLLQQLIIIRHPGLQAVELRGTLRLRPFIIPFAIMIFAFILAISVPAIGLWGLALFAVSNPLERIISRRKKTTP